MDQFYHSLRDLERTALEREPFTGLDNLLSEYTELLLNFADNHNTDAIIEAISDSHNTILLMYKSAQNHALRVALVQHLDAQNRANEL
jgi:hypothetical protein